MLTQPNYLSSASTREQCKVSWCCWRGRSLNDVIQKIEMTLRASVWSKNKEGGVGPPGASPGFATAKSPWIYFHTSFCWIFKRFSVSVTASSLVRQLLPWVATPVIRVFFKKSTCKYWLLNGLLPTHQAPIPVLLTGRLRRAWWGPWNLEKQGLPLV